MGFGTGLNAILAYRHSCENNLNLVYTGIEKYPLMLSEVEKLNYPRVLDLDGSASAVYQRMHVDQVFTLEGPPAFRFRLFQDDIANFSTEETFDVMFFDAFGPATQPELWTLDVFIEIHSLLHPGSVLVTYSAKGTVRRAMQSAGFIVERIPGPPGKREMLRAIVP
jgi:tRNA U34 5-methylaminomethyl-2-thiouridine-forming methyltransferase MnmC